MKKTITYFGVLATVVAAMVVFASTCKPDEKPTEPERSVSLTVSPALQKDFVPIHRTSYKESELDLFFSEMRRLGDEYCRLLIKKKGKVRAKKAAQFIRKERIKFYMSGHRRGLTNIMTGCWNFFKMNDLSPDRDFRLARLLKSGVELDCFSVGYLQPYIMHSVMNCTTLTMLDIDWRIHDGHLQLIRLYRSNLMNNKENIRRNIQRLHLPFMAHLTGDPKPTGVIEHDTFCRRHNQQPLCRKYLREFHQHFPRLKSIRLNLSALHDADYKGPSPVKVVYLSNAIERIYTTPKQFKKLIRNLADSLNPGGSALIIHHVGGYRLFGLYELRKDQAEPAVKTLCRDMYRTSHVGAQDEFYESYFEEISRNKTGIPRCWNMLRTKERQEQRRLKKLKQEREKHEREKKATKPVKDQARRTVPRPGWRDHRGLIVM